MLEGDSVRKGVPSAEEKDKETDRNTPAGVNGGGHVGATGGAVKGDMSDRSVGSDATAKTDTASSDTADLLEGIYKMPELLIGANVRGAVKPLAVQAWQLIGALTEVATVVQSGDEPIQDSYKETIKQLQEGNGHTYNKVYHIIADICKSRYKLPDPKYDDPKYLEPAFQNTFEGKQAKAWNNLKTLLGQDKGNKLTRDQVEEVWTALDNCAPRRLSAAPSTERQSPEGKATAGATAPPGKLVGPPIDLRIADEVELNARLDGYERQHGAQALSTELHRQFNPVEAIAKQYQKTNEKAAQKAIKDRLALEVIALAPAELKNDLKEAGAHYTKLYKKMEETDRKLPAKPDITPPGTPPPKGVGLDLAKYSRVETLTRLYDKHDREIFDALKPIFDQYLNDPNKKGIPENIVSALGGKAPADIERILAAYQYFKEVDKQIDDLSTMSLEQIRHHTYKKLLQDAVKIFFKEKTAAEIDSFSKNLDRGVSNDDERKQVLREMYHVFFDRGVPTHDDNPGLWEDMKNKIDTNNVNDNTKMTWLTSNYLSLGGPSMWAFNGFWDNPITNTILWPGRHPLSPVDKNWGGDWVNPAIGYAGYLAYGYYLDKYLAEKFSNPDASSWRRNTSAVLRTISLSSPTRWVTGRVWVAGARELAGRYWSNPNASKSEPTASLSAPNTGVIGRAWAATSRTLSPLFHSPTDWVNSKTMPTWLTKKLEKDGVTKHTKAKLESPQAELCLLYEAAKAKMPESKGGDTNQSRYKGFSIALDREYRNEHWGACLSSGAKQIYGVWSTRVNQNARYEAPKTTFEDDFLNMVTDGLFDRCRSKHWAAADYTPALTELHGAKEKALTQTQKDAYDRLIKRLTTERNAGTSWQACRDRPDEPRTTTTEPSDEHKTRVLRTTRRNLIANGMDNGLPMLSIDGYGAVIRHLEDNMDIHSQGLPPGPDTAMPELVKFLKDEQLKAKQAANSGVTNKTPLRALAAVEDPFGARRTRFINNAVRDWAAASTINPVSRDPNMYDQAVVALRNQNNLNPQPLRDDIERQIIEPLRTGQRNATENVQDCLRRLNSNTCWGIYLEQTGPTPGLGVNPAHAKAIETSLVKYYGDYYARNCGTEATPVRADSKDSGAMETVRETISTAIGELTDHAATAAARHPVSKPGHTEAFAALTKLHDRVRKTIDDADHKTGQCKRNVEAALRPDGETQDITLRCLHNQPGSSQEITTVLRVKGNSLDSFAVATNGVEKIVALDRVRSEAAQAARNSQDLEAARQIEDVITNRDVEEMAVRYAKGQSVETIIQSGNGGRSARTRIISVWARPAHGLSGSLMQGGEPILTPGQQRLVNEFGFNPDLLQQRLYPGTLSSRARAQSSAPPAQVSLDTVQVTTKTNAAAEFASHSIDIVATPVHESRPTVINTAELPMQQVNPQQHELMTPANDEHPVSGGKGNPVLKSESLAAVHSVDSTASAAAGRGMRMIHAGKAIYYAIKGDSAQAWHHGEAAGTMWTMHQAFTNKTLHKAVTTASVKTAERLGGKLAAEGTEKLLGKLGTAGVKIAGREVPVLGAGISLGFSIKSAAGKETWGGSVSEVASGTGEAVVGTVASPFGLGFAGGEVGREVMNGLEYLATFGKHSGDPSLTRILMGEGMGATDAIVAARMVPYIEKSALDDQTRISVRAFALPDGHQVAIPKTEATYPQTPRQIQERLADVPGASYTERLYRMMALSKQEKLSMNPFGSSNNSKVHDELSQHFRQIEMYEDSARQYLEFARRFNEESRPKLVEQLRKAQPYLNGKTAEEMVPILDVGASQYLTDAPKITAEKYPDAYALLRRCVQPGVDLNSLTSKQQHHLLREAIPALALQLSTWEKMAGGQNYDSLRRAHEQYSQFMKREYIPYTDKLAQFSPAMQRNEAKVQEMVANLNIIQKRERLAMLETQVKLIEKETAIDMKPLLASDNYIERERTLLTLKNAKTINPGGEEKYLDACADLLMVRLDYAAKQLETAARARPAA